MKAIKKILVFIDLDLIAEPVLDLAATLAISLGASIDLVHVFETPGYKGPEVLESGKEDPAVLTRWRTASVMMGLVRRMAEKGVQARGRMELGVAEERVCEMAGDEGFDLIVIGSHSREGLERFVQASIAGALIRTAPCPVLVLPKIKDIVHGV